MKPSIYDIARECDVSAMTVSRALRLAPTVATATRRRIVATAARLGYHRMAQMGRPRAKIPPSRPRPVNIIVGTMVGSDNLFNSQLLLALEQELSQRGYECVLRTCQGNYERFLALGEALRQSRTAGTLLMGYVPLEQLRTIMELAPCLVLVDHPGDSRLAPGYESVAFDNCAAARLAAQHLLELGRRRIALIKGFADHYFSREQEAGYRDVLAQHGMAVDPDLIVESDFTAGKTHELTRRLLERGIAVDAIMTNDEMACGVLQALHERRLAVPKKVAVVGCDGLPIGLQTVPPLTTVALDQRELARLAVERLLAPRGAAWVPRQIRLLPRLIVRASTVGKDGLILSSAKRQNKIKGGKHHGISQLTGKSSAVGTGPADFTA